MYLAYECVDKECKDGSSLEQSIGYGKLNVFQCHCVERHGHAGKYDTLNHQDESDFVDNINFDEFLMNKCRMVILKRHLIQVI